MNDAKTFSQLPSQSSVIQTLPSTSPKIPTNESSGTSNSQAGLNVPNNANLCSTEDCVPSIVKPKLSLGTISNNPNSERRRSSRLPLLFERAGASYFNPRFDSLILEEQYWKSTFLRTTRRFQLGLVYLLVLTLCLSIYFPVIRTPYWPAFLGLTIGTIGLVACMLGNLVYYRIKY